MTEQYCTGTWNKPDGYGRAQHGTPRRQRPQAPLDVGGADLQDRGLALLSDKTQLAQHLSG